MSELSLSEGTGVRPCWRTVRGCISGADKIYKGQGMRNMQGSPERAAKIYGSRKRKQNPEPPLTQALQWDMRYTFQGTCVYVVCMRACMCVCVHAYAFMCAKYVYIHVDISMHVYMHMYVDMCVHMYRCVWIHTRV